jgi:chromosome segregation ATPase
MAAARHDALCQWARTYAYGHTDTGLQDLTMMVEGFIQHHLSAALARVEGERDAAKHEASDCRQILQTYSDAEKSLTETLATLRAELAAKGEEEAKHRTALIKCHAHLCKEIQALSLNESAKAGSQSLLHEISVLLDSSALTARAAEKEGQS